MADLLEQLLASTPRVQAKASKAKRKRAATKGIREPRFVVVGYTTELQAVVDWIVGQVSRNDIDVIVARANIKSGRRADSAIDDAVALIERIRATVADSRITQAAQALARRVFGRTNRYNADAFTDLYGGVLPIRPIALTLPEQAFVAENVALIKSLSTEVVQRLEATIIRGLADGVSSDALYQQVIDSGASKARAALIADDQVAKANARLTQARQQAAGVRKARWSTSQDERVRKSHQAVNGQTYTLGEGLQVDGEQTQPGLPIRCFPGRAEIHFAPGASVAYRRWFTGHLTQLITEDGVTIECTGNHPILTPGGWVPANTLDVGCYVMGASGPDIVGVEGYIDHGVPRISEFFDTFQIVGARLDHAPSAGDFHGDGSVDHDVDIISIYRVLSGDHQPQVVQGRADVILSCADVSLGTVPGSGDKLAVLQALGFTPNSAVRGLSKMLAVCSRGLGHAGVHPFATIPGLDIVFLEHGGDATTRGAGEDSDGLDAASRTEHVAHQVLVDLFALAARSHRTEICSYAPTAQPSTEGVTTHTEPFASLPQGHDFHKFGRVVEKRVREFSGHVYNLQTSTGWYMTQGLVVSNCRCVAVAILPEFEGL